MLDWPLESDLLSELWDMASSALILALSTVTSKIKVKMKVEQRIHMKGETRKLFSFEKQS